MLARIVAGGLALTVLLPVAVLLVAFAGIITLSASLPAPGPRGGSDTGSDTGSDAGSVPGQGGFVVPGPVALADIPGNVLTQYQQAALDCPGLSWAVLAGIGKVETNHGRLQAPGVSSGANFAGAGGPMQFLAPTFSEVVARHRIPPGGAVPPSRYNVHDAAHAAAFYLCDNGAPNNVYRAVFAYNHADWYVDQVLGNARRYGAASPGN